MKQEIFELIVKARESIFELQNYLFENHREYYLAAKGVLENSIEHIANIEATIDEAEDEMLAAAKKDLSLICYTTIKAKDAYNAPVVQNVSETQTIEEAPTFEEPVMVEEVTEETPVEEEPTEEIALVAEEVVEAPVMEESVENTEEVALIETTGEENIEFNEEELNNLLAALDSANFEAIFEEEITPVTLEETEEITPVETEVTEEVIYETETPVEEVTEEPTFEEEVAPVEETIEEPVFENSEEIDIQALDAFLNENATDDDDAFRI